MTNKIEVLQEVYQQSREYLEAMAQELEVARAVAIDAYHNLDAALMEEIRKQQGADDEIH